MPDSLKRKFSDADRRAIINDAVGAHAEKHKATPGSCTGWMCWYDVLTEVADIAFERGAAILRKDDTQK